MFSKKKSKRLAESIAEKYHGKIEDILMVVGAFSNCRYKVKFKFGDMKIEAYPYLPHCQIWIQNFRYSNILSFSTGKSYPLLGLTIKLNNVFQNTDTPVFCNEVHDYEVAKQFCMVSDNELDIVNLNIGEKEHLVISTKQIFIHNYKKDIETISDRIIILKNIFDRNCK